MEIILSIIYLLNIFTSLTIGIVLLGVKTAPHLKDKRYRRAKKYVGVASIINAVGNAIVLSKGMAKYSVDMFSVDMLTMSALQVCLFTFSVIILFHSPYVTRRNVLINLAPTIIFFGIYIPLVLLKPDVVVRSFSEYTQNISNPGLILRTLFAAVLMFQYVNYVRIFKRERRIYIEKINHHFADTSAFELKWGSSIFYQAAGIGFTVLLLCIYSDPIADGAITILVTVFYITFAIRYINYQYTLFYALPAIREPDKKIEEEEVKEKECVKKQQIKPDMVDFTSSDLGKRLDKLITEKKPYLIHGVVIYDIAKMLDVSDRKLSYYISNTYRMNFNKWINSLRISHAKKLLVENPTLTIERVGEQCGFPDKSKFSRTLKELTGNSFKDFKNQ